MATTPIEITPIEMAIYLGETKKISELMSTSSEDACVKAFRLASLLFVGPSKKDTVNDNLLGSMQALIDGGLNINRYHEGMPIFSNFFLTDSSIEEPVKSFLLRNKIDLEVNFQEGIEGTVFLNSVRRKQYKQAQSLIDMGANLFCIPRDEILLLRKADCGEGAASFFKYLVESQEKAIINEKRSIPLKYIQNIISIDFIKKPELQKFIKRHLIRGLEYEQRERNFLYREKIFLLMRSILNGNEVILKPKNITFISMIAELAHILSYPESINQGALDVCGPASLLSLLAIKRPDMLVKLTFELLEQGKCSWLKTKNLSSYSINHANSIIEVLLTEIRRSDNWLGYSPNSFLQGFQGPSSARSVARWLEMFGCDEVEDCIFLETNKGKKPSKTLNLVLNGLFLGFHAKQHRDMEKMENLDHVIGQMKTGKNAIVLLSIEWVDKLEEEVLKRKGVKRVKSRPSSLEWAVSYTLSMSIDHLVFMNELRYVDGQVYYEFLTYGQKFKGNLPLVEFLKHYRGAVIANVSKIEFLFDKQLPEKEGKEEKESAEIEASKTCIHMHGRGQGEIDVSAGGFLELVHADGKEAKELYEQLAQSPSRSKPTGFEQASSERMEVYNVSGYRNNCGLFALVLGVKLALRSQPGLKGASLPKWIDEISNQALQSATVETQAASLKLRAALGEALRADENYRGQRLSSFMECCLAFVEDRPTSPDMSAFVKANKAIMEKLKAEWAVVRKIEGEVQRKTRDFYRSCLAENLASREFESELKTVQERLSEQVLKTDHEGLRALIEHCSRDADPLRGFIKARQLFRATWFNVWGSGKDRCRVLEILDGLFSDKAVAIFKARDKKSDKEKGLDATLLLALAEQSSFNARGALERIEELELDSSRAGLFIRSQVIEQWPDLYKQYWSYLETSTELLTADELGCLAGHWDVQLKIQFKNNLLPYQTYETRNPAALHVTLCNPTQIHWMVLDGSSVGKQAKILSLLEKIKHPGFKKCFWEAVNNEAAYAEREKSCRYLEEARAVVQDMPMALNTEKALRLGEIQAMQELCSIFIKEGILNLNAEEVYRLKGVLAQKPELGDSHEAVTPVSLLPQYKRTATPRLDESITGDEMDAGVRL